MVALLEPLEAPVHPIEALRRVAFLLERTRAGTYRVEDSSRATWSAGQSDFFGYLGQTGANWGIGVGFSRVSRTNIRKRQPLRSYSM